MCEALEPMPIKKVSTFQRKWDSWKKLLASLADTSSSGKLICPDGKELSFEPVGNGVIRVTLPYSICFYAVPQKQKGASNITSSKPLAVFIDGYFCFGTDNDANLSDILSTVAFYRIVSDQTNKKSLELVDAYHFDFFNGDVNKSSPHPVFHAQRNIHLNDVLPQFKKSLGKHHAANGIEFKEIDQPEKDKLFGLKSFRVPTPQMDILNLGAVIAADQLVGNGNAKTWDIFNKLLSGIHGDDGTQHLALPPDGHAAGIYATPRKHLPDWYLSR